MRHAKPAESLIETIVAITVIVLATAAALSVMRTSVQGNDIIGKKTVAINLALEGFEILRNIRDTNYLLLSTDPDECWDTLGITDVSDCSSATGVNLINNGYTYYFSREVSTAPYFDWRITRLTNYTMQGFLNLYDVDTDSDGDDDVQLFAQTGVTNTDFTAVTGASRLYQRYVTISNKTSTTYDATITVRWYDNGVQKSLVLTRTLANVY